MANTHIRRIETHLDKVFKNLIDLSDLKQNTGETERRQHYMTRALAAYILTHLAGLDPAAAAAAITDGYQDGGIDALYFSEVDRVLFVVQAKWSEGGKKTIEQGENLKFLAGFKRLLLEDFSEFNDRILAKEPEVQAAVRDVAASFRLVLVSTAEKLITREVQGDIDSTLEEVNGQNVPIAHFTPFNQKALYSALLESVENRGIDLTITLHDWGMVTEPYLAYYGQIDIGDVLDWKSHGLLLFKPNLRSVLGRSTEVHASIENTLKTDPQNFWYFNNGATILCRSLKKQPKYGDKRHTGIFECRGVGVVNGAQTIGAIWHSGNGGGNGGDTLDPRTRLQLRLISLDKCPEGFDSQVTRACNTQIRIERRDFAALDPNQSRLSKEMQMDGKRYIYRSGDEDPKGDDGCSITEATVALACASQEVGLAVQAKREVSKLWENIETEPYTLLFNDRLTADVLWRGVRILRAVENALKQASMPDLPRADLIAIHGNRFILYRVFQDAKVKPFRDQKQNIEIFETAAARAVEPELRLLVTYVLSFLPGSYPQSLFKNAKRCKEIDDALNMRQKLAVKPATKSPMATLFDIDDILP